MEPFSVFKVSWQPLASKHTEVELGKAAQNWKMSGDGRLEDRGKGAEDGETDDLDK